MRLCIFAILLLCVGCQSVELCPLNVGRISRLCQRQFNQDPFHGHYYIFRNKRKTSIKLLYYDTQGFCLFQKRLSTGRFVHWPTANNPLVTLTSAQLQVLLSNGNPQETQERGPWRLT